MKYLAVILLICVAATSAQIPFRCKSPDAWEARFYEVQTGNRFSRSGRIYYDAPGERLAIVEEYSNGEEETASYMEYFFFKEKYMLRFNTYTKQCTRSFLNETFNRIEVPPTAEFIETHIIGTNAVEQFGLAVNVWADNFGPNGRRYMEFVADDGDGDEDCLPVVFAEFGGGPGSRGFRHQSFYDIVLGVNPSHFIPPEGCPSK